MKSSSRYYNPKQLLPLGQTTDISLSGSAGRQVPASKVFFCSPKKILINPFKDEGRWAASRCLMSLGSVEFFGSRLSKRDHFAGPAAPSLDDFRVLYSSMHPTSGQSLKKMPSFGKLFSVAGREDRSIQQGPATTPFLNTRPASQSHVFVKQR